MNASCIYSLEIFIQYLYTIFSPILLNEKFVEFCSYILVPCLTHFTDVLHIFYKIPPHLSIFPFIPYCLLSKIRNYIILLALCSLLTFQHLFLF
jgi:hypothetical protein